MRFRICIHVKRTIPPLRLHYATHLLVEQYLGAKYWWDVTFVLAYNYILYILQRRQKKKHGPTASP